MYFMLEIEEKSMKAIYEFYWDCGRMGCVKGLFIADKDEVEKLIGSSVSFGEILGKHSDVYGTLDESDLTIKTEDQDFISKFEEFMGVTDTISGYNPLEYLEETYDDEE
ncbi:hypothetical protein AXI64_gp075 [Vibrio phage qdvp001]|uniref:hypothetical protein n=1 Tax=Vibrio phage qdvp001 TaxID=1003177 RepID=UPI00071F4AF9|nr:hypothetical protein AXI64_gp075 [Vibrio phage qdvp001]ALM62067.1 hypothetical protein qdvp001_075 [Vibrio phage qdvp001]